MGGVLETYEKLLSQMLKQLPTPSPQTAGSDRPASVTSAPGAASVAGLDAGQDVRTGLSNILEMVQYLRKHNYQDLEKLMQGLHSLKHIQVKKCRFTLNNLTVIGLRKAQMRFINDFYKCAVF